MKKKSGRFLAATGMALWGSLFFSIMALAAGPTGTLTEVNDTQITGWAWDEAHKGDAIPVELHIYKDYSGEPAKVVTVQAGEYNSDVQKLIGDGNHGFSYPIDLKELGGSSYKVEAYAVSGESKTLLPGVMEYNPRTGTSKEAENSSGEIGPGIPKKAPEPEPEAAQEEPSPTGYKKGPSLGIFKTTGYCPCKKCSAGSGLTYSGTVPQANHTISADRSVLPIGSKVMIGDTVYTVEDIGGGVKGNTIDIFFQTHQEALNYGVQKREVFSILEV